MGVTVIIYHKADLRPIFHLAAQDFQRLANEGRTTILFETPHRLRSTLEALRETMGDRTLVIARELTKLHEEILRGSAEEILQTGLAPRIKGEVTIVIEGKSGKKRRGARSQSVES